MSLEDVANEDLAVKLTNSAGPPDLVYTGDVGITDPACTATVSTKCKAAGKGVCTKDLIFVWAVGGQDCPHTSATYTFVSGAATILPGATKVKAEGQLVLRKTDTAVAGCIGVWNLTAPPNTPIACACSIEISDAGQTKAKAQ